MSLDQLEERSNRPNEILTENRSLSLMHVNKRRRLQHRDGDPQRDPMTPLIAALVQIAREVAPSLEG
jgi:hypothetical protein